ncbi:alginate export family protein [Flavobacterium sp. FZUC8N2.13]|uniref:Alginate export family protein n=1 Tax=Flavobacterium zubiriense TaxID=3138075 RepID=A0ABV4TAZ0_9FLAO
MKKTVLLHLLIVVGFFCSEKIVAQDSAAITHLLLQKKLITQKEADSLLNLPLFNPKENFENKSFAIGLEFRPRIEYRDGYKQLPTEDTKAAYFGTQRSRLNFNYEQPKFKFHTSIQDIRVWGQYELNNSSGSLNVFEAYIETAVSDRFLLKIGRQKVELDNGRIFSAANWRQSARAHDGINLIYESKTVHSELITAFNQTSERIFETDFAPTTFTNYKMLNVHYLKAKLNKHFTLTTINSADSYQSKTNANTLYTRGTSGGRLDFEKGNLYLTFSGYYQYGQLQTGNQISAYYFQPEIQLKTNKLTTRLGAEYMSGDNANKTTDISKSFVPLYGVAWRFMGNMDYFTSFPIDLKNGGLINPYLFFIYDLNKKVSLRSDFHLFYLQNKVKDNLDQVVHPYLGFENDLSFHYKYNSFTMVDFGFSYMAAKKSMETLKGGNSNITPVWSYVMITFKPELFSFKK